MLRSRLALAPTRARRRYARFVLACWLVLTGLSIGPTRHAGAQIEMPAADPNDRITVTAENANRWEQGSYEVWLLRGDCHIRQGPVDARSDEAVLWIDHAEARSIRPHKVIAYLEGNVVVDRRHGGPAHLQSGKRAHTITGKTWQGHFQSTAPIQMRVSVAQPEPAVYQRSIQFDRSDHHTLVKPAQFTVDTGGPPPAEQVPPGTRRIDIFQRSNVPIQASAFPDPQRNEWVGVITSGVNMIIDGVQANVEGFAISGKIDISTDRLVIWSSGSEGLALSGTTLQRSDRSLEIYMEGNIVFRQGDLEIFAERMYYNATAERGIVLEAELFSPVPDFEGLVRLKADVLQILDRHHFQAFDASATSSRLGVPGYWFQSESLTFQDVQQPLINPFTGQAEFDLKTGEPIVDHQQQATSRNNFVYVGGVPVFYWPVLATNLDKPTYYVDQLRLRNDSVFGAQILADLDVYQLFGIRNPPEGTEWGLSLDYLSERGFGLGTNFTYARDGFLNLPGPNHGYFDAWGINDNEMDNLGRDRRALVPEEDLRGRVFWQHRHELSKGFQLSAELGVISDRNFLEQFYEREWDELKDQTTGLELKQILDNSSWSVTTDFRVNDFFTRTEWLPRLDHFRLGEPLLLDRITWHEHSHVGYANLETATTPLDPVDAAKFDPLAWEAPREGLRAATRQEIDWPFQAGPVKVVPYALGEVAHWGEVLSGDEMTRVYGQLGSRASLPIWRVDPGVQSALLNLNGLAHKVVFDADISWSEANRDLAMFPLYDPLDDDSVEHFRRRFFFDTFGGIAGGNVPLKFDERFYALRSGIQSWVTGPSTEIADDLMAARFGIRQRWQTKRGLPGQERIIDWILLDVEGVLFPNPGRDNFGQDLGLLDYNFRWHVGDRLTLLSDGMLDLFGDGLRTFTMGGFISRPERGNLYVGFRSIEGPFSSNIVTTSFNYRMSDKWISSFGTAFDFGPTGNIGQSLTLTRIGESFLVSIGLNADASRDNVGAHLAIEPRFMPRTRRIAGIDVLPAGTLGIE